MAGELFPEDSPVARPDLAKLIMRQMSSVDFELPDEDRWILGKEISLAPMGVSATGETIVISDMAAPHKILPRDPRRFSPAKPRRTDAPQRGRQSGKRAGRTKKA